MGGHLPGDKVTDEIAKIRGKEKVKEEEAKVTKEEINAEIDNMLERYSEIAVKEGKVENGNIAIIDFEGVMVKGCKLLIIIYLYIIIIIYKYISL